MPVWLPYAIDLIKEWIKEGEPKKASIERLWESLKKLDTDDTATLGTIMEVQGVALQGISKVLEENKKAKKLKAVTAQPANIN